MKHEPQPCVAGQACDWDEEDNPPSWWRDEIDQVRWQEVREGDTLLWFEKTADCPRCHDADAVKKTVPAEAWAGVATKLKTMQDPAEQRRLLEQNQVYVSCECWIEHPKRPKDIKQGCGHSGYVTGLKVPAGFVSPMHRHSNDERVVVLRGTSYHWTDGESPETARRMRTGDFMTMPAGVNYVSAATEDYECIEFVTMEGKFDFTLA